MTEEQAEKMIELLKGIDWKLWEMYNIMKDVLDIEEEKKDDN